MKLGKCLEDIIVIVCTVSRVDLASSLPPPSDFLRMRKFRSGWRRSEYGRSDAVIGASDRDALVVSTPAIAKRFSVM